MHTTILLYFLSVFVFLIYGYKNNGYEVRDLEGTDAEVVADSLLWNLTGLRSGVTSRTSSCLGKTLLAGYNVLSGTGSAERIYENLIPHDIIYLSFQLWAFDNLETTDQMTLSIDDVPRFIFNGVGEPSTGKIGRASCRERV